MSKRSTISLLVFLSFAASTADGANVQSNYWYQSTVTTDGGGPLDLLAELNYDDSRSDAPIAVVMHGYSPSSGNLGDVRTSAQRLRDAGFFAISVAMRGRDGSDGVRDSGGIEIYDIYDAVESVIGDFAPLVDDTNIHITGYSGGGGNTMSALTKFPDYFRVGAGFFGMSDYGYDPVNGWYFDGADGRISTLNNDIGDPTLGDPDVQDRYHARASNLASRNNPYSEIHLFVNHDETICPPVNDTTYRDNAVAAESFPSEFDNITVHTGGLGEYEDFDGDSTNDPEELQSWSHGFLSANAQYAAEAWYLDRLLSGAIPQPALNAADTLFVAGFVKTRQFELWLGDGQEAAGELNYDFTTETKSFSLQILSNDKTKTGALTVNTDDMAGQLLQISRNGESVDLTVGGGQTNVGELADGDLLTLEPIGETGGLGDFDLDLDIDEDDYDTLLTNYNSDLSSLSHFEAYQLGDMNGDRFTNFDDLRLFRGAFDQANGAGAFEAMVASVPEPSTGALIAVAASLFIAFGLEISRRMRSRRVRQSD